MDVGVTRRDAGREDVVAGWHAPSREAIKYERKRRKMTQPELAVALRLGTHMTVSSWERGATRPRGRILLRLLAWMREGA